MAAWPEDGKTMVVLSPDRKSSKRLAIPLPEADGSTDIEIQGWVMMTRMPGKPVSTMDLSSAEQAFVGKELARIVSSWRTGIPHQGHCGNVRIELDHERVSGTGNVLASLPDVPGSNLKVLGLLVDGIHLKSPISTGFEYVKEKLNEKLRRLDTEDAYVANRHLSPLVRSFMSMDLPKLAVSQQTAGFVFTHFDLSPRNILATRSSAGVLQVSGIVDFEFSGLFSPLDEFVNDFVDNGMDWTGADYQSYLDALSERGIATPAKGYEGIWQESHLVGELEENIAPWWLPGSLTKQELLQELQKAEQKLRDALTGLAKTIV